MPGPVTQSPRRRPAGRWALGPGMMGMGLMGLVCACGSPLTGIDQDFTPWEPGAQGQLPAGWALQDSVLRAGGPGADQPAAPWTMLTGVSPGAREIRLEMRVDLQGDAVLDVAPAGLTIRMAGRGAQLGAGVRGATGNSAEPGDGAATPAPTDEATITFAEGRLDPASPWWTGYWNQLRVTARDGVLAVWVNGVEYAQFRWDDRWLERLTVRDRSGGGVAVRNVRWRRF